MHLFVLRIMLLHSGCIHVAYAYSTFIISLLCVLQYLYLLHTDGEAPGSVRSRGISSHDSNSTFEYAYGHDVRSSSAGGGNSVAGNSGNSGKIADNGGNTAHFVIGSPGSSNRSGRAGLAVGYPGALGGSPPTNRNKTLLPTALLNASTTSPQPGSAYNMHNATISPRSAAGKAVSPTSPATPPAGPGVTTTSTSATIASGIRAAEDIGASSLEEMDIM